MACRTWSKTIRLVVLVHIVVAPTLAGWCGARALAQVAGHGTGELAVTPAMTPLAPGSIEPRGWIRDWAIAARDGLTGHLDEYHPTFRDAWKGIPPRASTSNPDEANWPLEQCAYWLDGLLRLGYVLHDDALIRKATSRLDPVVESVNRGAASFIYWKNDKPRGFSSWAHSQMGRALVAWYEATGDKRILDALVKVYSNYLITDGQLRFEEVTGLCNLDPMLETYRFSGDRRILGCAQKAMNLPDVQASIGAWREGRFAPGHAVIAYEDIRLPALYYLWTGESKYLEASRNAFAWINANHMLPYGVVSGEEYHAGVGAFRLTETCNISAQIWSSVWLYRILGERCWGDGIERAFFNAAPGAVARDFKTMCYYQSPNRIRAGSLPTEPPLGNGKARLRFGQLGDPKVLCCVGSLNRIIPNYVIHMWMASGDGGLAATLYGPCDISTLVGGKTKVNLTCETAYPFDETIRITVKPEQPAEFPLHFRIPGWCAKPRIAVNGDSIEVVPDKNGFACVARRWNQGDVVTLALPMSVRVDHGFETEFPPSAKAYFDSLKKIAVFQKQRLPFGSVSYGPLLFALPIPDQDPNTPAADTRWQYALDAAANCDGGDIAVERKPMPPKWDWPLASPLVLSVPARAFDWIPTESQPLPSTLVQGGQSEMIGLVPYGCTKFRISMFPLTANAGQSTP